MSQRKSCNKGSRDQDDAIAKRQPHAIKCRQPLEKKAKNIFSSGNSRKNVKF